MNKHVCFWHAGSGRACLSQLVVMVREAQVLAPCVDVDAVPQHMVRHGRALYVPPCTLPLLRMQHVESLHHGVSNTKAGGNHCRQACLG